MNLKEHRIYQYLSEPVRLVGLTKDEIIILLCGFGGAVLCTNLLFRLFFLGAGIGGVWIVKRFKKSIKGFSFISWLHWKFGIPPKHAKNLPHSSQRRWLP